jgi:hypothetical protein
MSRSRYDDLHDRFFAGAASKAGTRYERLAALVLKAVNPDRVVIHDLKLIGISKVKHQIDVVLSDQGGTRRVLVECKDFDTSGQKVGLEIVRGFFGAVEDIRPDDAFVISCTGFTAPAVKYSKAKGIQPVVLRMFEDADWEGRIKEVHVQINALLPPRINNVKFSLTETANKKLAKQALRHNIHWPVITSKDQIFLLRAGDRLPLFERMTALGKAPEGATLPHTEFVELPPSEYRLQIADETPVSFEVFRYEVDTPPIITSNIVVGNELEVLLMMKGYRGDDVVIFDHHLKQLNFDENRPTPRRPDLK